ncbi:uncharacterized protein LOC108049230 isoform X1 [Drosophila rhopaloa]|uniref:Uncharacterized protein LOC108049230 isoform X1 n=1 Tax=Drosophila rhopaloa TaxID=1041015 RepID=A0A6P4FER1_DRORH|nr:uncharacterized protein LOC108049230 isoform X1 [Drosophila rhopaloa]
MSSSTPGSDSALVKVATPSPSPLVKMDVDFTGSKFEMHSSLSDEERRFYLKMYPNVDLVNQRRVHCTVCKLHLGTAPASENSIKMHPILRVTHCVKCHDFYNSGEFSKGEDGSELYCRWCGQGGEVYCCSTCPYVFCKSCIVKNLSKGVIVDIEQNEHWNCFSCTSKILWPLRAQHWALVNYIQTQKRALHALQLPEGETRRQLLKDSSNCCRLAKSKASSLSDSMESLESNVSRRSQGSAVSSTKRGSLPKAVPSGPPAKRPKSSNDEVVCTPDLLSMLEPDCQLSVTPKPASRQSVPAASITTTPRIVTVQQNYQPAPSSSSSNGSGGSLVERPSIGTPRSSLPPPLVLSGSGIRYRQNAPGASPSVVRRTVVPNSVKTPGPVFHTINGFRVDLNSAAQQDSYRLPNGRLIQVKRQLPHANQPSPPPPPPPMALPTQPPGVVIRPRPPLASNRPGLHISSYGSNMGIYNPQTNQQQRAPHVRVANANQAPPPTIQAPPPNANGGQTLMITPAPPPHPKVPTLVRHNFPNTPMGMARAQLQEQIFSAMDICTHLTGKVVSLTHSNAYNQVRNYMELKELYIHMSYLMTYAIGRFKNLQEKCLVDMREKGFKNDANSLENGQLAAEKQASDDEDNEIEIVEPKTDTITIDSDNEDDTPSTSTQQPQQKAIMKITSVTSAAPKREQMENQVDIDVAAFSSTILASLLEVDINDAANEPKSGSPGQKKQPRKKTTNKPNPALLQLERQRMEEMKNSDAKLKMKVVVKLKRAEDEFEVARKWVEDCRKRQQKLATEKKDSSVENDDSDIKNKEKIGEILKAAIKAKIGEKEKKIAEEKLVQEESFKEKITILASKEIEKKKVSEVEKVKLAEKIKAKISDKEMELTKENKDESKKVADTDQESETKVSEKKKDDSTKIEVFEKEKSHPKEMDLDSEKVLEKDQKNEADTILEKEKATKNDPTDKTLTIAEDDTKVLKEKCSEAATSDVEEVLEKEKSEDKEKEVAQPLENKGMTEGEMDTPMDSGKDTIKCTVDKEGEVEKTTESELVDQDTSDILEIMDTTNENDEPSAAELMESMDVTELDEAPKELLDCAIDEVIAMDGIELSAATEELMKALISPSGLTSENANEDETELDANDLIENLPLETTEPPEILLKEDESEITSKSESPIKTEESGTHSASSAENGDPDTESTQESSECPIDSALVEPATAEIVG